MSLDKLGINLGKMGKSLSNFQQLTREKLGNVEDITGLPPEYHDLERRVDNLDKVHKRMLQVTRIYTNTSYDYPDQIRQSVVEISNNLFDQLKNITQNSNPDAHDTEESLTSSQQKNLHHALARASNEGAALLDSDDTLGTALKKYGTSQERIGDCRYKMDSEISLNFYQPFYATLHTQIQGAMKARANVKSARLSLDAAKNRYKSVRQERIEAARLEVEQAEDQFVAAVEEATTLMKQVIETPEPHRNLAHLVNAQLTFHQEACKALNEVVQDIEEMQLKQESLYR
ncbi:10326_t:CDS:2 [Cetraspora pellucida]|uniref:10326_t:CDS:1 n=1 Tax=Cetraspora pellucida TaxID=1433469 RepID=A0A9N9FW31_9GLOM|nr:10326_t:CDS:2 [Cetraspora pellucida]